MQVKIIGLFIIISAHEMIHSMDSSKIKLKLEVKSLKSKLRKKTVFLANILEQMQRMDQQLKTIERDFFSLKKDFKKL